MFIKVSDLADSNIFLLSIKEKHKYKKKSHRNSGEIPDFNANEA